MIPSFPWSLESNCPTAETTWMAVLSRLFRKPLDHRKVILDRVVEVRGSHLRRLLDVMAVTVNLV